MASHDRKHFDLERTGGAQMTGVLLKKPVGHKSTTWSRRFFVLKEGFLMYYAESEKKVYEEKFTFNIHPKGVIPLGYCTIEEVTVAGVNYGINVNFPDNNNAICLGAVDEDTRRQWIEAMDIATRITLENANLGESMIRSLQEQGLQLAREKQEYYQKYIRETEAVGIEREQRKALEEFNEQLAEEKLRIEVLVDELHLAHVDIKNELIKTTEVCKVLEEDRENMKEKAQKLQITILDLSTERTSIIKHLRERESSSMSPTDDDTTELRQQLVEIVEQTKQLEEVKKTMEEKLEENQIKLLQFSEEKKCFFSESEELKREIQELNEEKLNAETNLKVEIAARMHLQQELNECQAVLLRLESDALNLSSSSVTRDVTLRRNIQFIADVKSLKNFFENFASERDSVKINYSSQRISRRFTNIKKLRDIQSPSEGYSSVKQDIRASHSIIARRNNKGLEVQLNRPQGQ